MAGWKYYDWNSTASTTTDYSYLDSSSSTDTVWIVPVARRILVPRPKLWGRVDEIAFAHLVNKDTRTGWVVEMLIEGDVLITDPSIDVREMCDFLPLMRKSASGEDLATIAQFFIDHPI